MSQSGSLAQVMEKIGALIQAHDNDSSQSLALDNIRVLAANTPGQAEALNTALTDVITEIEGNVDTKIKAGFSATQAAVTSAMNNLKDATSSALTAKAHADQADQLWFNCIGVEKSKRVDFEAAAVTESAAIEAIVQPCKDQEDSNMFESTPQVGMMTCDFSAGDSCDKQMDAYTAEVDKQVDDLASEAEEASQVWTNFKSACDSAYSHAADMTAARETADAAWQTERGFCQTKHEDRLLGQCNFGTALQTKCDKVGAYSHLIEEVDAVKGGPNSEPDRQAEWKTTQVTKCMLQKVIDGIDLNSDSLAMCESAVKYIESVGQFNRMLSDFTTQTSETSFTCDEQTITFNSGETWNVPKGVAPASSEYTTGSFRPEISLEVDTPPFDFCGGKPQKKPSYESRPETSECATYKDQLPMKLGTKSHSVVMSLEVGSSAIDHDQRQWLLNIGQTGALAEHWLYNAHKGDDRIQFGSWGGKQINVGNLTQAMHLATTYDSSTKIYTLYINGQKESSITTDLDIKSKVMTVGLKGYASSQSDFQGCIRGVDIYESALTAAEVGVASSLI